MDGLPVDLCFKIFCLLDHQTLANSLQVCRKWRILGSNNSLWANLFKERWGGDHAEFCTPLDSKSWKDVYEVQDRCDRVGLGLKIIREGGDYYLVHQGKIRSHLGSKRKRKETSAHPLNDPQREFLGEESVGSEELCLGILDKILFFIGDLESASADAKRSRVL